MPSYALAISRPLGKRGEPPSSTAAQERQPALRSALGNGDSEVAGCRLEALFTVLGHDVVSDLSREAPSGNAAPPPLRAINASLPNPDAPSSDAAVLSGCQMALQAINAAYDAHAWLQLPDAAALFPQLND